MLMRKSSEGNGAAGGRWWWCWPYCSGRSASGFLKSKINAIPSGTPDEQAKDILKETIDEYIHHNIELAAEQISITACEKIRDGDVYKQIKTGDGVWWKPSILSI